MLEEGTLPFPSLTTNPQLANFDPVCGPPAGIVFCNWNPGGVSNGPTSPTIFSITTTQQVAEIIDYHYPNGPAAGTIGLKDKGGRVFGPWKITASIGYQNTPNVIWTARFHTVLLPAGTYQVIDSSPATWSFDGESGGQGFSEVRAFDPASLAPHITSVDFSGAGQNLHFAVHGSGFGSPPVPMPFTGNVPGEDFYFYDLTHVWTAGHGTDGIAMRYASWSDTQIVVDGFGNGYGTDGWVATPGDKVHIGVMNKDSAQATEWTGTLPSTTPSPASAYANAVLADHPVVYYRLDETSGRIAHDLSGHGYDASYGPATRLGVPGAIESESDTAAYSPSGNTLANYQSGKGLPAGNTAVSIEEWVKSTGAQRGIGTTYGTRAPDEAIGIGNTNGQIGISGFNDDHLVPTPYRTDDDKWHQLVLTYGGATTKVYLDGAPIETPPFTGRLNITIDSSRGLVLGECLNMNCGDAGALDEVSIYDHALSAEQVAAHYKAADNIEPPSPKSGFRTMIVIVKWGPERAVFTAKHGIETPEMPPKRVIFRHCPGDFISVRNPD